MTAVAFQAVKRQKMRLAVVSSHCCASLMVKEQFQLLQVAHWNFQINASNKNSSLAISTACRPTAGRWALCCPLTSSGAALGQRSLAPGILCQVGLLRPGLQRLDRRVQSGTWLERLALQAERGENPSSSLGAGLAGWLEPRIPKLTSRPCL